MKTKIFILLFCLLFLFLSCGIEVHPFILPIPEQFIDIELNNWATVRIPYGSDYDGAYSQRPENFVIFYRIYVTYSPEPAPSETTFPHISTVLRDDFVHFRPHIQNDTDAPGNMDDIFRNRRHHTLNLGLVDGANNINVDINTVLSFDAVSGRTLIFDFGVQEIPRLTIVDNAIDLNPIAGPYILLRSDGGGFFNPLPANRRFLNTPELWNPDNIINPANNQPTNINDDVVNHRTIADGVDRHTFVAMYIVAQGSFGYTNLFSAPRLIHVFLLPEPWS